MSWIARIGGLVLIGATATSCGEQTAPTEFDYDSFTPSAQIVGDNSVSLSVSGFAHLYQATNPEWVTELSEPPVRVPNMCIGAGGAALVTASGCVIDQGANCTGPDGHSWLFRGLRVYSLIGRWSTDPDVLDNTTVASDPFFVGANAEVTAPATLGFYYLFLAENDGIFDDNGGAYSVTVAWDQPSACLRQVLIDIKPGSDPNCFNINGHGVIPVAILGSADFDVSEIDVGTLLFGGLEVRVRGKGPLCHVENTNGDSYPDLVCQFEDDAGAWVEGNTTATLTGELPNDILFEGTDAICIVP